MIDENELMEIKARAERATPGPWFAHATNDVQASNALYVSTDAGRGIEFHDGNRGLSEGDPRQAKPAMVVAITLLQAPNLCCPDAFDENTEFIAHARADVPRLVEEVVRLRAILGRQS